MAIRKSTMQEQVAAAIAAIEPNDRPVVTFHTISGPSPWLMSQLGLIGQLFVKYYFVTLTHRVVTVHRASRMSNRPQELVQVMPLDQARAAISDVNRATLWSSLKIQFPGEPKPTRLNIGRYWRNELDTFVNGLFSGGPAVPPQGQPYPPQGQQPYPPQGQAYPQPSQPGANPYQS